MTKFDRAPHQTDMSVFVLLEHGRGIRRWRERYAKGLVTDPYPYSYHLAQEMGCVVTFSDDLDENALTAFLRKGMARLLGFDLVHVLRNKQRIGKSDVVWMHTEQIHLAYTLLSKFIHLPPALCNSIWIADEYPRKGILVKLLWRWLLKSSSVNLTESVKSAEYVSGVITGKPVYVVRYGIDVRAFSSDRSPAKVLATRNLISVGNDRHRDWKLLFETARRLGPDYKFRILTRIPSSKLPAAPANVEIFAANTVVEIANAYSWGDILCLPIQRNHHASGVTVTMEAAGASLPVLTSLVGGIDDYFPRLSAYMLDIDDGASEWASRITDLFQNRDSRTRMQQALNDDIEANELTAIGYVSRLVARSKMALS